jgi:hypothetical protein
MGKKIAVVTSIATLLGAILTDADKAVALAQHLGLIR